MSNTRYTVTTRTRNFVGWSDISNGTEFTTCKELITIIITVIVVVNVIIIVIVVVNVIIIVIVVVVNVIIIIIVVYRSE